MLLASYVVSKLEKCLSSYLYTIKECYCRDGNIFNFQYKFACAQL